MARWGYSCAGLSGKIMTDDSRRPDGSRPRSIAPGIGVLAAGVALVGLYYLLAAVEVGGIGAPTDIGGGVMALLGFVLVITGSTMTVVSLRRRR